MFRVRDTILNAEVLMENYTKKTLGENGIVVYRNSKKQKHRLDGPAVEWSVSGKEWWINGKCHRLDGPAVMWPNRTKHWFIKNKNYSKSCHNRLYLFFVLESRRIDLNSMED